MRAKSALLGSLALVTMLVALAPASSAILETIAGGDSFEKQFTAHSGDTIYYVWYTTGGSLHFILRGPGNTIVDDTTSTGGGNFVFAEEGTYTFIWTNDGTTSVTLDYTVNGASEVTHAAFNMLLIGLIIAVVIVIVIVVIVVLVVVQGGKKKAVAQQPMMPMGPPVVDGKCARCGNPVDPNATWCPKCGAPLR